MKSATTSFEDARWERGPQSREFRHQAALMSVEGERVLDVGCGDGLFLSMLAEEGKDVVGADISPKAIALCKEKGFSAEVLESDTLPFPDNSFDTVIALDVLEHLYTPEVLLKEMARVSKGTVIVGVPNFVSLPARIQALLGRVPENNRPKQGHIYWFTLKVLRALGSSVGLSEKKLLANTFWEQVPGLSLITKLGRSLAPSVFALSFIMVFTKKHA